MTGASIKPTAKEIINDAELEKVVGGITTTLMAAAADQLLLESLTSTGITGAAASPAHELAHTLQQGSHKNSRPDK